MRVLRLLMPMTVAAALVQLASGPASAAPPGNDVPQGAVSVFLGDRVTEDTSQATTDAQDAALNASCGAPATHASVWFTYSPSADNDVALVTTGSSYSTGLMVFKGTPTANSLINCGPDEVGLRAQAGNTYYVMVFSDTATNGGSLVLSVNRAPTPTMHAWVVKRGVAFHGGAARVHGIYRCRHAESFAELDAHLLQRAGRLKIQAESGTQIRCDAKPHHWSVRLVSPVGTYAAGNAVARISIFACGLVECRHAKVRRHIHLAWAPGSSRQQTARPSAPEQLPRPLLARQGHWPGS